MRIKENVKATLVTVIQLKLLILQTNTYAIVKVHIRIVYIAALRFSSTCYDSFIKSEDRSTVMQLVFRSDRRECPFPPAGEVLEVACYLQSLAPLLPHRHTYNTTSTPVLPTHRPRNVVFPAFESQTSVKLYPDSRAEGISCDVFFSLQCV